MTDEAIRLYAAMRCEFPLRSELRTDEDPFRVHIQARERLLGRMLTLDIYADRATLILHPGAELMMAAAARARRDREVYG